MLCILAWESSILAERLFSSIDLPIVSRCVAGEFFEAPEKIIGIGASGFPSGFGQGDAGGAEQIDCPVEPELIEEMFRGGSGLFPEELPEMIFAHIRVFRHFFDGPPAMGIADFPHQQIQFCMGRFLFRVVFEEIQGRVVQLDGSLELYVFLFENIFE